MSPSAPTLIFSTPGKLCTTRDAAAISSISVVRGAVEIDDFA
jgi:hypothetical protein